jgi:hypothetical protein
MAQRVSEHEGCSDMKTILHLGILGLENGIKRVQFGKGIITLLLLLRLLLRLPKN